MHVYVYYIFMHEKFFTEIRHKNKKNKDKLKIHLSAKTTKFISNSFVL